MKLEGIQIVRGMPFVVNYMYNDGWIPSPVVVFGSFGVDLFFVEKSINTRISVFMNKK